MTRLPVTPLYSTFLRVETLIEQHKPLEALVLLDKELQLVDTDVYLHQVRLAYAKHLVAHERYLTELQDAWTDFQAAIAPLLEHGDKYDLSPEAQAAWRSARQEREARIQAVYELCQAHLPEEEPAHV